MAGQGVAGLYIPRPRSCFEQNEANNKFKAKRVFIIMNITDSPLSPDAVARHVDITSSPVSLFLYRPLAACCYLLSRI